MEFFKKGPAIFIAGIMLLSCTACSGFDKLADGLKSGVEQVGSNVAIGKSNALITPYQSFDGKRVSDNAGFLATYDAAVNGFDGQDILVGNTALKSNDCRKITVHYSFDTISGVCRLVYIDPELEEKETNFKIIQEIMGHKDIATTMNIYAEATREAKQNSMSNLEGKIKLA